MYKERKGGGREGGWLIGSHLKLVEQFGVDSDTEADGW
jgi:hypothetical protein